MCMETVVRGNPSHCNLITSVILVSPTGEGGLHHGKYKCSHCSESSGLVTWCVTVPVYQARNVLVYIVLVPIVCYNIYMYE